MPIAIYILSMGAFAICTSEFVIMGLLPSVSASLHVSLAQSGFLVTGYAIGVVVGAPVLTPLVSRLPPRPVLLSLMGLFLAGNLACALAPSYTWLLVFRLVTALTHASFFGIGSVVASRLAPAGRQASAIAGMFLGATLATILGVPIGAALGQALGWRATFVMVVVVAAIACVCMALFIPEVHSPKALSLRDEILSLKKPSMLLALLTTVFGNGGPFVLLTYIAAYLTDISGLRSQLIPVYLFVFGAGMVIGNPFGARLADRNSRVAIRGTITVLMLVLFAFAVTPHSEIATGLLMLLFGAATFAVIPPLQTEVLLEAGAAPMLAAATNIAAFNLGNAAGAWLGTVVVGSPLGLSKLPFAAGAFAAIGLGLALRRYRPSTPAVAALKSDPS